MKTGDRVRITYEGRTVFGHIKLASKNQRSLMLSFEAILGGYVGMMPVLLSGESYRDLLNMHEVKLDPVDDGSDDAR